MRLIFLILTFIIPALGKASFNSTFGLDQRVFADGDSGPRLGLVIGHEAEKERRSSSFHLSLFYDADGSGNYGYNLDHSVIRWWPVEKKLKLLAGRYHPLKEALDPWMVPEFRSAYGQNWVSNTQDPLSPLISGWVGTGALYRPSSKVSISVMFSPVYIPSFGPNVVYSEDEIATSSSKFAKLPPSRVRINDEAALPLYIALDTGDIKDIILQEQYFAHIHYAPGAYFVGASYWSAPTPNPEVDLNEKLQIKETSANVAVTARPKFPRQNFVGALTGVNYRTWSLKGEWTRELKTEVDTYSLSLEFRELLTLGALYQKAKGVQEGSSGSLIEASYSDKLGFLELDHEIFAKTKLRFRYERHFSEANRGQLISTSISRRWGRFLVSVKGTVLTGIEGSYFGSWRSLDHISTGLRYVW